MGTLSKVMIVRHAEKPEGKDHPPFGVTADGVPDFESLTVAGWQRAGALISLFVPRSLARGDLATPTVIYASRTRAEGDASADEGGSKSKRPLQTVVPLAAKLHLQANVTFGKGEEAALALDVLAQSWVVLISWQH